MSNLKIDPLGNKRWNNSKGELHNTDGPAVIDQNGFKAWWLNNKLHRLDGPACEYTDGYKEWWVAGTKVDQYSYHEAVLLYKCKQVLES
jgi:hypothetical protein